MGRAHLIYWLLLFTSVLTYVNAVSTGVMSYVCCTVFFFHILLVISITDM